MTQILRSILRSLARATIWRYRPGIVGVTGSVGKTSTKLAIQAVLGRIRRVRIAQGNLNNDFGLPLTILGEWSPADLKLISRDTPAGTLRLKKFLFWIKVVFTSAWRVVFKTNDYPDILVLEYGADRPGDIKYLLRIARPNVSVITAVGDTPVHVEFYNGPEDVAREKGRLIECLPVGGFAILNNDDDTVMNLAPRTRARVITYGFEKGAQVSISRFENRIKDEKPAGISFRLGNTGSSVPVTLEHVYGKSQAYACAAATSVGLIFGMNLVKIAEAMQNYKPAASRMELVPGIKYTWIIDDSYNASPISMTAALDTLRELPGKRKIAVLGDMLEIGKYAIEAHEAIGRIVPESADILFTVGPRAKFIAETASAKRFNKKNIYSFDTADEAKLPLQEVMKQGDVVLIKGSHAMELDKIVKEVKEIVPPAIE